jgi:hypothetical protein
MGGTLSYGETVGPKSSAVGSRRIARGVGYRLMRLGRSACNYACIATTHRCTFFFVASLPYRGF